MKKEQKRTIDELERTVVQHAHSLISLTPIRHVRHFFLMSTEVVRISSSPSSCLSSPCQLILSYDSITTVCLPPHHSSLPQHIDKIRHESQEMYDCFGIDYERMSLDGCWPHPCSSLKRLTSSWNVDSSPYYLLWRMSKRKSPKMWQEITNRNRISTTLTDKPSRVWTIIRENG